MNDYFRQGWQVYNRTYIAQVTGVDPVRGTINVNVADGPDIQRENLEVPATLSLRGFRSSWQRYMPQLNDFVYVTFGPRNEARVVGYGAPPGLYASYANQRTTSSGSMPSGDFTNLRPGEWDMRSSGGAYIYGNADGALLLSAGAQVRARLDKSNNEGRLDTGLWVVGGDGSFVRIGNVKRKLPGGFKEVQLDTDFPPATLDPAGATKEFYVHLESNSLTPLLVADDQLGAVRDEDGVPYLSQVVLTAPLRYRRKIWDAGTSTLSPLPTAAYSNEVDVLGNQVVEYGSKATKAELVGGPLTALSSSSQSLNVSTTTSVSVSAGTSASFEGATAKVSGEALAQLDAPLVQLGSTTGAVHPAARGEVVFTTIQTVVGSIFGLSQAMVGFEGGPETLKGAAWQTVATAMSILQGAVLAQPPGTPTSMLSKKVVLE